MYNPIRYSVDPETLRDVVLNPDEVDGWLDERLRAPVPAEPDAQRRHRTEIGTTARSLRRLALAESQLAKALELAVNHGSPQQVVLARVRHAHVLQWQDRFEEASAAFEQCLAELDAAGDHAHFVYQHAGKCAYDFADWPAAVAHFEQALRLRESLGDAELVASTRLALDAADACATASAVAAQLHRLVPGAHGAAHRPGAPIVAPAQPYVAILINSRNLLLAGPAPLAAVRAIHRYHADWFDGALSDLAGRGWLALGPDTVVATERCRELLTSMMALFDTVLTPLWGAPADLLGTLDALIDAARGTSEGDSFDALAAAGHPGEGTVAGRLFTALCALRHHRADAHAAAWQAQGLTADGVQALDPALPRRRRIEAATDQVAARPYRTLRRPTRRALVDTLGALPV